MISVMCWIVFSVLLIDMVLCGLLALGRPDGSGYVIQFAVSGVLMLACLVFLRML